MRTGLLVLLLCASCSPVYAKATISPNHQLGGERWVTVLGPDDDATTLAAFLQERGFRVSRQIPGDTAPPLTRYVLSTDGVCGAWVVRPTVHVQLLDRDSREVVFESNVKDRNDCPNSFFRATVAALDSAWPK